MEPHIFFRCEGKIFLLTNAKARAKHSFSALKYLKPIYLRHREVRKAPGIAICTKKVKNKWSSNENYVFYSGRHLCLFHWRARFRNLGTRKMINQSDKSLLCSSTACFSTVHYKWQRKQWDLAVWCTVSRPVLSLWWVGLFTKPCVGSIYCCHPVFTTHTALLWL